MPQETPRSSKELDKCPPGTQGAEKGDLDNRSTAHTVVERVFSMLPARETAPGYGGSGTASSPHGMEGVRPSEPIQLSPAQPSSALMPYDEGVRSAQLSFGQPLTEEGGSKYTQDHTRRWVGEFYSISVPNRAALS